MKVDQKEVYIYRQTETFIDGGNETEKTMITSEIPDIIQLAHQICEAMLQREAREEDIRGIAENDIRVIHRGIDDENKIREHSLSLYMMEHSKIEELIGLAVGKQKVAKFIDAIEEFVTNVIKENLVKCFVDERYQRIKRAMKLHYCFKRKVMTYREYYIKTVKKII